MPDRSVSATNPSSNLLGLRQRLVIRATTGIGTRTCPVWKGRLLQRRPSVSSALDSPELCLFL